MNYRSVKHSRRSDSIRGRYKNDAALFAHLANPAVGKYLEDHAELADTFVVEIYGTIGPELQRACDDLPFPVRVFETQLGYSRL